MDEVCDVHFSGVSSRRVLSILYLLYSTFLNLLCSTLPSIQNFNQFAHKAEHMYHRTDSVRWPCRLRFVHYLASSTYVRRVKARRGLARSVDGRSWLVDGLAWLVDGRAWLIDGRAWLVDGRA